MDVKTEFCVGKHFHFSVFNIVQVYMIFVFTVIYSHLASYIVIHTCMHVYMAILQCHSYAINSRDCFCSVTSQCFLTGLHNIGMQCHHCMIILSGVRLLAEGDVDYNHHSIMMIIYSVLVLAALC